jgi:hypothetical protein
VVRVILQSFVELNSCSALISSSQLMKKCHCYYSISILISKIYHKIVKIQEIIPILKLHLSIVWMEKNQSRKKVSFSTREFVEA